MSCIYFFSHKIKKPKKIRNCVQLYLHGGLSEAVIEQLHVPLLLLQLLLQLGDTSLKPSLLLQQ